MFMLLRNIWIHLYVIYLVTHVKCIILFFQIHPKIYTLHIYIQVVYNISYSVLTYNILVYTCICIYIYIYTNTADTRVSIFICYVNVMQHVR